MLNGMTYQISKRRIKRKEGIQLGFIFNFSFHFKHSQTDHISATAYRQKNRQTPVRGIDRQTNRQTDRQTDRQTEKQTDRQTNRQELAQPDLKQAEIIYSRPNLSLIEKQFTG